MSHDQHMTAAVLHQHGGPEVLRLHQKWPVPHPNPGQAVVRVTAAALNNTDLWTREGAYGLPGRPDALAGWRGPLNFPRIQGGDIAGVVSSVAEDVPTDLVGRRVLVDPALYSSDQPDAPPAGLLGSEADGGFATFVTVDTAQLYDMGASPLSDEELSALPVAYGTAMGMLERAVVAPGETLLVTGASGGVGFALVQLAAVRGAHVLALSTSAAKAPLEAAGASTVLDRNTEVDALRRELADLAPGGLDAVADVAGGPWLEQFLPMLRDDARWVIAGAVAGPVVPFDLRRLYLHNLTLIGSSMHTREHFSALTDLARTGAFRPRVASRHPLTDLPNAQDEFRRGGHVGKIVVVP